MPPRIRIERSGAAATPRSVCHPGLAPPPHCPPAGEASQGHPIVPRLRARGGGARAVLWVAERRRGAAGHIGDLIAAAPLLYRIRPRRRRDKEHAAPLADLMVQSLQIRAEPPPPGGGDHGRRAGGLVSFSPARRIVAQGGEFVKGTLRRYAPLTNSPP